VSAGEIALVDSHAHLDFPEFEGRLEKVLARAAEAGVGHVITIGISYETARKALEIAARFPDVSAAAGIHPNEAAAHFGEFEALARLFETEALVGVGETGLDFYRNRTPAAVQEESFRAHIELALARDLPLVIHVRDAYEEALRVLDASRKMPRGVFHCYSGTAEFAREAVARGFFISVAGQVTFKNADALRAAVATVPLERLLVETDCPYLAPAPHRGKDNEPAYVRFTAERIAEVMGVPFEEVARATTANARRLFGIGERPQGRAEGAGNSR
jgi:TatD DNase family protein